MAKREAPQMKRLIAPFMSMLGLTTATAQEWPALRSVPSVSGRAAVEQDVADGKAIFVLKVEGVPAGKPVNIPIPQYAYLLNPGANPTPVILVQAEEANGTKLFGV